MAAVTRIHKHRQRACGRSSSDGVGPAISAVDLTYAVEPILTLHQGPHRLLGLELLYRGGDLPPDQMLMEWLGQGRPASVPQRNRAVPVHVNLDTTGILRMPEHLVRRAALRQPLVVEWTEEPVADMAAVQQAGECLSGWRHRFGLSLAVDDLGSGVNGLTRAATIEGGPDVLKLSGRLFHRARRGKHTRRMLETLLSNLPASVLPVIEAVETREDYILARAIARESGLDARRPIGIQGWLFPSSTETLNRPTTTGGIA